jgi:hypothetical protein
MSWLTDVFNYIDNADPVSFWISVALIAVVAIILMFMVD